LMTPPIGPAEGRREMAPARREHQKTDQNFLEHDGHFTEPHQLTPQSAGIRRYFHGQTRPNVTAKRLPWPRHRMQAKARGLLVRTAVSMAEAERLA